MKQGTLEAHRKCNESEHTPPPPPTQQINGTLSLWKKKEKNKKKKTKHYITLHYIAKISLTPVGVFYFFSIKKIYNNNTMVVINNFTQNQCKKIY
jgi:hypothetical protein